MITYALNMFSIVTMQEERFRFSDLLNIEKFLILIEKLSFYMIGKEMYTVIATSIYMSTPNYRQNSKQLKKIKLLKYLTKKWVLEGNSFK